MSKSSLAPGVILACFAAGPLFMVSTALATLYTNLPNPIVVSSSELLGFVAIIAPSIIVGGILALGPTMVGASAMRAFSERYEAARAPIIWTGMGALCGAALALALGAFSDSPAAFGLIATSALCACICRFQLQWD